MRPTGGPLAPDRPVIEAANRARRRDPGTADRRDGEGRRRRRRRAHRRPSGPVDGADPQAARLGIFRDAYARFPADGLAVFTDEGPCWRPVRFRSMSCPDRRTTSR
jgi:hypothetical protein